MPVIPQDPDQFFDVWLPSSFQDLPPEFKSKPAAGAVVFHVGARQPYALRLTQGAFVLSREVPGDTIVQVSVSEADFAPVLVRGAELVSQAEPERRLMVLRALTLDAERIELVRGVRGNLAFVLTDGDLNHRVVLTPSVTRPVLDTPECSVRCQLADFLALQRGESNPFELMMNGKIQISGDAQIPMALSSLLM